MLSLPGWGSGPEDSFIKDLGAGLSEWLDALGKGKCIMINYSEEE